MSTEISIDTKYATKYVAKHVNLLTQHFVARHIDAGHAERRIRVGHVLVDGELPVVDAAREAHGTEGDAMLPALHRNGGVVVAEQHAGADAVAEARIEGEPGDCFVCGLRLRGRRAKREMGFYARFKGAFIFLFIQIFLSILAIFDIFIRIENIH